MSNFVYIWLIIRFFNDLKALGLGLLNKKISRFLIYEIYKREDRFIKNVKQIGTLDFNKNEEDLTTWCMLKLNDDLFVCGGDYNVIKIWKLKSENPVRLLKGHTQTVKSLLKLLKEDLIASAGHDSTIRIWSLETDEALYILNGNTSYIYCLIFIVL